MNVRGVVPALKLDAFILNSADPHVPLAPITKPNYSLLRLDRNFIQPDVLGHIDSTSNDRTFDQLKNKPRANRSGIYLHWMLPPYYRSGFASTENSTSDHHSRRLAERNLAPIQGDVDGADHSAPVYRPFPNRWLVIRRIERDSLQPLDDKIPEYKSFVIESDRVRSADEFVDHDLEIETSNYVDTSTPNIDSQGEVLVGYKSLDDCDWKEEDSHRRLKKMTTLDTANHLFADYTLHNSNVLSFLDDMSYVDSENRPQQIKEAIVDYTVLGWHSDLADDPFHIPQDGKSQISNAEVITRLNLVIDDDSLLDDDQSNITLLQGSLYLVAWSSTSLPSKSDALDAATLMKLSFPISLGTTTLDATLAFVQAHQNPDLANDPYATVARDILKIQTLLLKDSEDVDSQLEATDMLYEQSFTRIPAGSLWHISGANPTISLQLASTGNPTASPSSTALDQLNSSQRLLDATIREQTELKKAVFGQWWRYINDDNKSVTLMARKAAIKTLSDQVTSLQTIIDQLLIAVKSTAKSLSAQSAAANHFYNHKDPLLFISGIKSPWPRDWSEPLFTRSESTATTLQTSITAAIFFSHPAGQEGSPEIQDMIHTHDLFNSEASSPPEYAQKVWNIPGEIRKDITRLMIFDWRHLRPHTRPTLVLLPQDESDRGLPVYARKPRRDVWTQPFFPLFIEWEVEYFHIPFDHWGIQEINTKWQYALNDTVQGLTHDCRLLSGRSVLLPQPSVSLRNNIQQIFKHADLQTLANAKFDNPDEQKKFLQELTEQLPFLSCPLTGFVDHLITKCRGTHVKPNMRVPGRALTPLPESMDVGLELGLTNDLYQRVIGKETGVTPYGSAVEVDPNLNIFKPVTHGQFRFKKLNIVDKFGQVVVCVDSDVGKIFPWASEYFACQTTSASTVNAVVPQPVDQNEFVQIPPRINQPARLNARFVVQENGVWRPTMEAEDPVWGWLVMNFLDSSFQIFFPNGEFYREVSVLDANVVDNKWTPFLPPSDGTQRHPQLDSLIQNLHSDQYLKSLFKIIGSYLDNAPPAPTTYADSLAAIVGKPLALVNTGWSLELAEAPLTNQSDICTTPPGKNLVDYAFRLKLGDSDRSFDGLVGYFTSPSKFDNIFTYLATANAAIRIEPSNCPPLNPFYISPSQLSADDYSALWNKQLKIISAIIDPFVSIHGYTFVLPQCELKLPSSATSVALARIATFFRVGPLILTTPPPGTYSSEVGLVDGADLAKTVVRPDSKPIMLPAATDASGQGQLEWQFLHPYLDPNVNLDKDDNIKVVYNAYPTKPVDNLRMGLEQGPYTAVEGYLRCSRS